MIYVAVRGAHFLRDDFCNLSDVLVPAYRLKEKFPPKNENSAVTCSWEAG